MQPIRVEFFVREEVMARATKAKTSKRPQRASGYVATAELPTVGDIETFTAIREMHDRLDENGAEITAPERSHRLSVAAASVAKDAAADSDAPWISFARGELGQRDYPGPLYNPRVLEYLNTTGQQGNSDETSWCSAFVNWCMTQAGKRGTNNAAARSWLGFGQALSSPRPGCVVILWRESPSSWKGHVGFFDGWDVGNRVRLLAGNQAAVSIGTRCVWPTSRRNESSAIVGPLASG
jgi:uncharacterized protein (TIGR02594 family)